MNNARMAMARWQPGAALDIGLGKPKIEGKRPSPFRRFPSSPEIFRLWNRAGSIDNQAVRTHHRVGDMLALQPTQTLRRLARTPYSLLCHPNCSAAGHKELTAAAGGMAPLMRRVPDKSMGALHGPRRARR